MKKLLFLAMLSFGLYANAARPPNPTLALSDQVTNSSSYLRQVSSKVVVGNDSTAVKWCLSETQSTAPSSSSSACVGGQGSSNGWYTSRPTSFNVSVSNGNKKVYVWVANSGRSVNLGPVSDQIILDTVAPVNQSVSLSDSLTGSTSKTNNSLVNLSMIDDTSSVKWCLIEQSSLSPNPQNPLFNDACWNSSKPSSLTLGATGSRTVFLYSKDSAENISAPVMTTMSYSTTPPQDPTLASGQYTNTSSISVAVSNDSTATKWCLSESQSERPQFGTSPCSGGWLSSRPVSMTLSALDGSKTLYLWVSDSYNNVNMNSVSASVTLDTAAPALTIGTVTPSEGLTNKSNISVDFSSNEQVNTYCSVDGSPYLVCQSPLLVEGLQSGTHSVSIYSVDLALNTSQQKVLNWNLDLVAPTVTVTASNLENPTTSVTNSFTLGSSEQVQYECSLDLSAWASCTSPHDVANLTDGMHSFKVRGTDLAGNTSAEASYSWTVDTNRPVSLSLLSPSSSPNRSLKPVISVNWINSGDLVSIYSDQSCTTKLAEKTSDSTSMNIDVLLSTYGSYSFYFTVSGSKNVECSNSSVTYEANYVTGAGFPLYGPGTFLDGVFGIYIDSANNIYTTAKTENKVKKFNSAGVMTLSFGDAGSGDGQFSGLQGVVTDSSGNIYTLETCLPGNCRIQKFNSSGVYQAQAGAFGFFPGEFGYAYALAIDENNNLYVTDIINSNVSIFDSSLNFQSTFGMSGSGNGELDFPTGIYSKGGYVYVVDSGNKRVQKFDTNGNFVSIPVSGYPEANAQGNTAANGIYVDSSGKMFVTDYYKSRVMKFSASGSMEMNFGSYGTADGQFNLPFGIMLDSSGNIYVADSLNKWVQKFSPSGLVVHE